MKSKKMYWIEDVSTFYGPSGLDYTAIGRVLGEDDLKKDGTCWEGCSETHSFKCYETLEDALNSVKIKPSSLRWDDSLTEKDTEAVREWAKEKDYTVFPGITVKIENPVMAEYEFQCSEMPRSVKLTFDKKTNEMKLFKTLGDNLYERVGENDPDFENLVKSACNSIYQYQVLFTDMDMRNSYVDAMKNNCMLRMEENMSKDYEER